MARPFFFTVLPTMLVLCLAALVAADTTYITGTDAQGVTRKLANNRYPALYTGNYGDCLAGGSLLNVTEFDAAYYADNMTVLFHLSGSTNLRNESVMIYISVDAYGEDRFDITFNPCSANIASLCPMNAGTPISGEAIIPVSSTDVAGIPSIALQIPDFEGSAYIRIIANTTQTQIGCFRAVMTNGATFSQPTAVSPVLAVFALMALIASFTTAIYGSSVTQTRTHFGHALPVMVVFEVFQSIFFSSTLNLNWPSVLAAWWSNFAWSAGIISSSSITSSINKFVGVSGNSSQAGGAGSVVINNNGGLQQQVYRRSIDLWGQSKLIRRAVSDGEDVSGSTYGWAGGPVAPGLPVPGNWTGFAGELQELEIPVAGAFLLSLTWLVIFCALMAASVAALKGTLEAFVRLKWIQRERLASFRTNWLVYLGQTTARLLFIAIPMMLILTIFQFSQKGQAGVTAVAAVFFVVFVVGGLGVSAYATWYRLRFGRYETAPDHLYIQSTKTMKAVPWFRIVRASSLGDEEKTTIQNHKATSIPIFRVKFVDKNEERPTVHEDPAYVESFGWLTAHYRRSRWWFFAVWVLYQFVRACFIGGASAHPSIQVIGLFIIEIVALVAVFWMRPFEGTRNTSLAVYMLSFSKVATAGLSIAFLSSINLARIPATIVGIVIIVIQGLLTIALLALISLGAVSSYMSLTRTSEDFHPRNWKEVREKYFKHLDEKAPDAPRIKPVPVEPEEDKEPYFSVNGVRRAPKIEDEEAFSDIPVPAAALTHNLDQRRKSRSNSVHSTHSVTGLPRGARTQRMSFNSKDFVGTGMGDIDENSEMTHTSIPNRDPTRRASMKHKGNAPEPLSIRPVASLGNFPSASIAEESEIKNELEA